MKAVKQQNDKMSVIIPYHGRIEFFYNTMDNLAAQTTRDFEVVISDDSNNDIDIADLARIVEKYGTDLDISVVRTMPNLGAVANTYQGLRLAKNNIIRILHTDDAIAPDTIGMELELFAEHPDAIAVFHNTTQFRDKFIPKQHGLSSDTSWVDTWLKNKALWASIVPSCLAFRRDEMLDKVGFFDPKYEFTYDWEYQSRLFEYAYMNNKKLIEIMAGYVGWRLSDNQESCNKPLVCWKDSHNLIIALRNSYNRMGFWSKRRIAREIKKLKSMFRNRLLADNKNFRNFKLPFIVRIYKTWKWVGRLIYRKTKTDACRKYRFLFFRFKISHR